MLPAVYFGVPETTWVREEGWGVDSLGNLIGVEMSKKAGTESGIREGQEQIGENKVPASTDSEDQRNTAESSTDPERKFTFRDSIALFNGRKSEEPFLRLFLRPFSLFLHPSIVWVRLHRPLFPLPLPNSISVLIPPSNISSHRHVSCRAY